MQVINPNPAVWARCGLPRLPIGIGASNITPLPDRGHQDWPYWGLGTPEFLGESGVLTNAAEIPIKSRGARGALLAVPNQDILKVGRKPFFFFFLYKKVPMGSPRPGALGGEKPGQREVFLQEKSSRANIGEMDGGDEFCSGHGVGAPSIRVVCP